MIPKALLQLQLGRCLGNESGPRRPKSVPGEARPAERAGPPCFSAWPCRRVSRRDFKTQTPHRPSPHTQSLVGNNTRRSRGHSPCQTLQGRQGVTLSHRCGGLKGHSDLQSQALPVRLRGEHRTETFAIKPATACLSCGAGCGRVTLASSGGRGQKYPGLVSYQCESSLLGPPALGWGLTQFSFSFSSNTKAKSITITLMPLNLGANLKLNPTQWALEPVLTVCQPHAGHSCGRVGPLSSLSGQDAAQLQWTRFHTKGQHPSLGLSCHPTPDLVRLCLPRVRPGPQSAHLQGHHAKVTCTKAFARTSSAFCSEPSEHRAGWAWEARAAPWTGPSACLSQPCWRAPGPWPHGWDPGTGKLASEAPPRPRCRPQANAPALMIRND